MFPNQATLSNNLHQLMPQSNTQQYTTQQNPFFDLQSIPTDYGTNQHNQNQEQQRVQRQANPLNMSGDNHPTPPSTPKTPTSQVREMNYMNSPSY